MTESTQWGTALRQLILSVDDSSNSNKSVEASVVLPVSSSGNQVQLLNINAMPSVLDGSDSLEISGDSNFSLNYMATTSSDSTPAQISINKPVETEVNTTKPKSGRFGRILHL